LQNVQVHDQDSVQEFYQRFQLAAQPFGNGRG